MKIASLLLLVIIFLSCSKTKKLDDIPCDNTRAIITHHATSCDGWGIVVGGSTYPSRNIPDKFKIDSLSVCVSYSLFDDLTLCACCGGVYANIITIN